MNARSPAERLRASIERHLGLRLTDERLPEIERLLSARVRSRRAQGAWEYLREHVDGLGRDDELAAIAAEITVPETWFFRDPDQLEMVSAELRRAAAGSPSRPLRLLSAGCATGEEAYTFAMLARQTFGGARETEIVGVDVNPAALQRAERATYGPWSLRQTPPEVRERYFQARKRSFVVSDPVRASVRFARFNLAGPWPLPWPDGTFDVVSCRNVLMYLSEDAAARVLERLVRVVAPGGLLLLGHADRVGACGDHLELVQAPGAFGWRRRAARPSPRGAAEHPISAAPARRSAAPPLPRPPLPAAPRPSPMVRPLPPLEVLLELLEAERFEAVLRALDDARPTAWTGAHRLLAAAVPLHLGHTAQARSAGEGLVDVHDAAADAHHLLGLCAEHGGDTADAVEQHEAALYYDPSFATAHLHLGRLLRRCARPASALRHLRLALSLLDDETRLRVAAFAPGVGRAGLSAWARGEIRACGGDA